MRHRITVFLIVFALVASSLFAQQLYFESYSSLELTPDVGEDPGYDLFPSYEALVGIRPLRSDRSAGGMSLGVETLGNSVLPDFAISGSVRPYINELYYRVSIPVGNAPSDPGDSRQRSTSDLIQIAFGRLKTDDLLGLLNPFIYDGLRYSLSTSRISVSAEFGYQGLLVNTPSSLENTGNLLFLKGAETTTELPFWDNLEVMTAGLGLDALKFYGGPNTVISKLFVLAPELIGRQSPFFLGEYKTVLSGTGLENPIRHISGIAGSTGSLSRRMFYSILGSYSLIQEPGLPDIRAGAAVAELRTFLPGRFGPRIELQALASTGGFQFPQSLAITPDYLDFNESAALLAALNMEGLLWRSRYNPRLAFGWRLSGFAAGKSFTGLGLVNDESLEDVTGYVASGFEGALRFRPLRDLAFELSGRALWPSGETVSLVDARFTLEYRY